jgi:hypothetical protein
MIGLLGSPWQANQKGSEAEEQKGTTKATKAKVGEVKVDPLPAMT